MKNKERMLDSLKKNIARNSYFRHLTKKVGKGKKNGLRKLEVEEGDEVITVCDKDEIERRIMQYNKEHFSKVKITKVCKDKNIR